MSEHVPTLRFERTMQALRTEIKQVHTSYEDSYYNASSDAYKALNEAIKQVRLASTIIDRESSYSIDDRWQDA